MNAALAMSDLLYTTDTDYDVYSVSCMPSPTQHEWDQRAISQVGAGAGRQPGGPPEQAPHQREGDQRGRQRQEAGARRRGVPQGEGRVHALMSQWLAKPALPLRPTLALHPQP